MSNQPPTNRPFWRSFDELTGSERFTTWLHNEFADGATDAPSGASRRQVLKLAAASFLLSTLASCTRTPEQDIVPYVHAPEQGTPAKPSQFATTLLRGREAIGVLVTSYDGRPTKIEGNPLHPASLGATDAFAQADILTLCDPDRSQSIRKLGEISTWDAFCRELNDRLTGMQSGGTPSNKFAGLRILTGPVTSPTMLDQITRILKQYPGARWHAYDAMSPEATLSATEPVYDFAKAKVIACFDADPMFGTPGSVRYARDFANGRRISGDQMAMNRLYVAEPSPTITGSKADHRRIAKADEIESLLTALSAKVAGGANHHASDRWIDALADDLLGHRGSSLVIVGPTQPASVRRVADQINAVLGNVGVTVTYRNHPTAGGEDIALLAADAVAEKVDTLLILDTNVAYSIPGFADSIRQASWSAHLGLYRDETSSMCNWHVPMNHTLESWGDALAYDGTASPIQPLIAPLYNGHSAPQLLALLLNQRLQSDFDLVRAYWQRARGGADFDIWWTRCLRTGVFEVAPASALKTPTYSNLTQNAKPAGGMTALLRPSANTWDGHYVNNGWMQELPDPITKLTWDNAAWMSPSTAHRNELEPGDVIDISYRDGSFKAPVWIVPGQADETLTLPLGYGRTFNFDTEEPLGNKIGFNAYAARASGSRWIIDGVSIKKTGKSITLACTQEHWAMEGRDLARSMPLAEFAKTAPEHKPVRLTLFPDRLDAKQQWGMTIDLTSCIGCNACTIACQSENNIPTVGKDQVLKGREMHWIRVDRYFEGDESDPGIQHQPVPCMQCENAPCEVVCPVGATQHSHEGLNDMTYNRCVGTRYCSNNCPYKVRRFNFLQYSDREHESPKIHMNPQVTVRSRGVMEKCTYCVQRIRNAQIATQIDPNHPDQLVPDGMIVTACQQVCPTQAIVFGDVKDPKTAVSRLKDQPHNYSLLEELNTVPRTTYLSEVRNPNPAIGKESAS